MSFKANDGRELYSIAEALAEARLSRATFFRWVQSGRVPDAQFRNRNGYRVFTRAEIDYLRAASNETAAAVPRRTAALKFR